MAHSVSQPYLHISEPQAINSSEGTTFNSHTNDHSGRRYKPKKGKRQKPSFAL